MRKKHLYFPKRKQKLIFLKWALNENNELVHISQVKSGRACNCRCPKCGKPLIAKKGNIKVWHFAHESADCMHGYQSALHILAKEVIEGCEYIILDGKRYLIDEVYLEKSDGDFIPDVTIISEGVKYYIEIYVTHKVDRLKKLKLYNSGVTTFEVDLSGLNRDVDREFLHKFFTNTFEDEDLADTESYSENDLFEIKIDCVNDTKLHDKTKQDLLDGGFIFKLGADVKCPLLEHDKNPIINSHTYCTECPFIVDGVIGVFEEEERTCFDVLQIADVQKRNQFLEIFERWSIFYNSPILRGANARYIRYCTRNIKALGNMQSDEEQIEWFQKSSQMRNHILNKRAKKEAVAANLVKERDARENDVLQQRLEDSRTTIDRRNNFVYKRVSLFDL